MELRPTGGYIGACGLVLLEHGQPRLADFRSAFDVDWSLPEGAGGWPPLPLAVYEHLSHGTFRDANWSPSFPVAARALASAYARGMGRRPYGVLAINTGALAALLDALGPLRVPGYPGVLEAANAVHMIDYYSNDHVQGHAKVYLGRAAGALMHRLLHVTRRDLVRLVPAMIRLLVDREVQVYVGDSRAEKALATLGIDGQAGPAAGDQTDYLALIDANVGHSKINDRVHEDLAYLVTLPSGAATTMRASLTITYTNTARRTTLPLYDGAPLYQDFVRVLVPHGSRLLSSSGLEQAWSAAEEEGGATWSGYLAVSPAGHRTVRFFYQEPWSGGRVRSPIYRLQVRHQSGAGPQGLEIALIQRGRVLRRWHGTLWRDMVVSVALPAAPSG